MRLATVTDLNEWRNRNDTLAQQLRASHRLAVRRAKQLHPSNNHNHQGNNPA